MDKFRGAPFLETMMTAVRAQDLIEGLINTAVIVDHTDIFVWTLVQPGPVWAIVIMAGGCEVHTIPLSELVEMGESEMQAEIVEAFKYLLFVESWRWSMQ